MLKAFLLSLFLISTITTSNCADGCLKCDGTACRLCDFTLGYTLSNATCVKVTLDNCTTMNQRGACLSCNAKYYLDSSTAKCIAVGAADLIQNCATYSGPATCSSCSKGFYLNNGACASVDAPISNCEVQGSSGKCLMCQSNFYLSLDGTVCSAATADDTCSSYTNIECSSCKSGYVKNFNYYLYQLSNLSSPTFESDVTSFLVNNSNKYVDGKDVEVCQAVQIANCDSYETFNKCMQCSTGFYMDANKKCVEYPYATIDYCEVYSALNTCSVCKPGYFMETANSCVQVPTVDNCAVYTNKDNGRDCQKCVDGYFLLSINSCVARKNLSISNCAVLKTNAEACDTCNATYRATDDGFKCMSAISNCSVYEPSNVLSNRHACYRCSVGYYYDSATASCLAGTVNNCQIYEKPRNTCSICSNKFYLEKDECKPHNILANCDQYHPTLKNVCSTCNMDTYLFENSNACIAVTGVARCVVYKDTTNCAKCADGYYLSNNACVAIPVTENCLQRRGTLCGKCINDFILQDGLCIDSLDYIVNECEVDNVDGTVTHANSACFTCKANTYPLSYKDSYVCVENSYMTLLRGNSSLISNCSHYAPLENGGYECAKCANNLYLDNGSCVSACTNAARSTIYRQILRVNNVDGDKLNDSFYVHRVNVCSTTIPGCAIAAPNTVQNKIELLNYQCVQCASGFIARVDFSGDGTLITNPTDAANPFGDSPVGRAPGLECYSPTSTSAMMVGDITANKVISNCDYYKKWGNITGCTKCSFGYSGVVLDVVTQCAVYLRDAYTCKKCNTGYYLASAYECKQVTTIDSCVEYDPEQSSTKCTKCSDTKYLSNGACVQRVNSLNVANSARTVTADTVTCNSTFKLDTSGSPHRCVAMTPNCVAGTIANSVFTCTACNDAAYYLNASTGNCDLGSKPNCKQYSPNANLCLECASTHYVSNYNCIAHTYTDAGCKTWSKTVLNTCTECDYKSILFNVSNRCAAIPTAIPRCETYLTINTCAKCEDGYRLENLSTRCLAIPAAENCGVAEVLDYNGDGIIDKNDDPTSTNNAALNNSYYYTCKTCINNTARRTSGTVLSSTSVAMTKRQCFSQLSYKLVNCSTSTSTGVEDFANLSCAYCDTNFYPRDWTDKYTCLENSYFPLLNAVVTNCDKVEWVTSAYKCKRCVYPYGLKADGTCALACDAGQYPMYHDFASTPSGAVSNISLTREHSTCYAVPAGSLVANCAVYTRTTDYANIVCAKCATGYFATIDYTTLGAFIDGMTSVTGKYTSPISQYPYISKCSDTSVSVGDTFNMHGDKNAQNLIDNCKYYQLMEDENNSGAHTFHYGCVRCIYGYTGQVNNYTRTDATITGFITRCDAMSGLSACDVTNYSDNSDGLSITDDYFGAHKGLTKYFSCLKCSTDKYIPFLFAKSGANPYNISNLKMYNIANTGATYDDGATPITTTDAGKAVDCIDVYSTASVMATNLKTTTSNFPTNCALGVLSVDSNKDNTNGNSTTPGAITNIAAYCVACAPGFAPKFMNDSSNDVYHIIGECTAILNCGVSGAAPTSPVGTWFNSCSSCTHYYDIYTDKIDYTKCVADRTATGNCFAAYDVGPCVICKKGYDKNDKNICVKETVSTCDQPNINRNYDYYFNGNTRNIGMTGAFFYGDSIEAGCRSCPDNYKLTKITATAGVLDDSNLSKYICSDFKSTPASYADYTGLNCAKFGMDGINVKCKVCNASYILTDTFECKLATVDHCKRIKASDGLTCVECDAGYLNIGGKCFDKTTLHGGHCLTFDDSSAMTFGKCTMCADGYDASASGDACIAVNQTKFPDCLATNGTTCTKCKALYALTTVDTNKKYCYPLNDGANMQFDSNCLAVDEAVFATKSLKCTKCKAGFVVDNTANNHPTQCGAFYRGVVDNCASYAITGALNAVTFRCLTCATGLFYYKIATSTCLPITPVTNCSAYHANIDKCTNCADNYLLNPAGTACDALPGALAIDAGAPNGGYIQRCASMSSCNARTPYSGLSSQLSSLFSCHKCNDTNQIPLAVVRAGTTYGPIQGLNEFGFRPTSTQRFDQLAGESSVTCVAPVRATFNMAAADFVLPPRCGAAILNANSFPVASHSSTATNVDRTKIAIMCVACAPGWRAASATDASNAVVQFMVSSCTQIDRCESSVWFSACSQCESNNSYGYVEGSGIKYDKCVLNTRNPNCYATDDSDANNLKCKYCRKGYYLNRDGICELLHPPRCAYAQFRYRQYYESYNLGSGLFMSNDGTGCQMCDDGFVGLYNAAGDKQVCTQSPYITNNSVTANSAFLPFCQNYAVSTGNTQVCAVCKTGYVLTVEGKCVINTAIPDCAVAYNETICYQCNDPFVLVNRKCVAGTIDNCRSYDNDEVYANQVCTVCDNGFYLEDNKCKPGSITNCATYNDASTCGSCASGFGLVKSKNGIDYCFPIDASLNCSDLKTSDMNNGVLQCTACKSNNFVLSNNANLFNKTICMPFISVANCATYDTTPNIADSSFTCTSCAPNFFLDAGHCTARTAQPARCVQYSVTSDECLKCADKFFLSADKKTCGAFPNGIAGCRKYLSATTCFGCEENMYLKNNVCIAIAESDLIENCVYYDDPQTCSTCSSGFLVDNGKCSAVSATNCRTYENTNACDSCPSGYGLKLQSGLLNCVRNNIENCTVSTEVEPFECLVCNNNFYVNNGVCAAVTTPIANCIQYDGAAVCAVCSTGSVLSTNKQSCLKTTEILTVLDSNCNAAKLTADLLCNSCKPGYVFVNGVCSACSKRTLASGCYVCDPNNENTCLMCAPGYYQYDDGRCVKNGMLPDQSAVPDPVDKSVFLVKAIAVAVLLLVFG